MITCDLIGRLGNQLFQQACAISHALDVGQPYAFPTVAKGSYTGEVYFPHLPTCGDGMKPVHYERGHHYTPIPKTFTNGRLSGYWQSEKYFKHRRKEVIEAFQMPPIAHPGRCSIHLRFGDYVQFKDKHPPVTLDYIDRAIKHIIDKGCKIFLIFSDDRDMARGLLSKSAYWGAAWFDMCFEDDPKKAMRMMAGCDHNIIANSSFSWWGAYLGDQTDRIVVAPKVWFGPGNAHLDSKDIYCENWIKL